MTRWYRGSGMRGTILPAAIAVTASGIGVAVWAAGPYNDDGSDTLGDVAPLVISGSGANLLYRAMGSGQAESEMNANPPTQSIGFMSRNFKQAILTAHAAHNDHFGTEGWQPDTNNVLGLDAAVVVTNSYAGHMSNLSMPLDPNAPGKAAINSDFALVMSGLNGDGTTAACRSQERLDALSRLTISMHGSANQISHIYRRNDASGTSDTMRERVRINRFCNGQAPGGVKSDGVSLWHNLDADDMDPIRRDCVPFGPGVDDRKNQTRCTYWPYNATCLPDTNSTDNPVAGVPGGIPCTQGLVVALTDADPGASDITISIAHRVADDATVLGYAGREAAKQAGTTSPNINRISSADGVVRLGAYLLSRRLYLNHGDPLPQPANPNDPNDPLHANVDKQVQEDTLYNWATDPASGRCHVDPIIKAKGFVTCTTSCRLWPPPSGNICIDTPYPAAESLPGLCIATGKPGDGKLICCADGNMSTNNVNCGMPVCAANGVTCRSDADCCANLTCQESGVAWLCKP